MPQENKGPTFVSGGAVDIQFLHPIPSIPSFTAISCVFFQNDLLAWSMIQVGRSLGGAVSIFQTVGSQLNVTMDQCNISSNRIRIFARYVVEGYGAGMSVMPSSDSALHTLFRGCTFADNTIRLSSTSQTNVWGVGLSLFSQSDGQQHLTNTFHHCTFDRNVMDTRFSGSLYGGGVSIYVKATVSRVYNIMEHCSVSENRVNGIWSKYLSVYGTGLSVYVSGPPNLGHSFLENTLHFVNASGNAFFSSNLQSYGRLYGGGAGIFVATAVSTMNNTIADGTFSGTVVEWTSIESPWVYGGGLSIMSQAPTSAMNNDIRRCSCTDMTLSFTQSDPLRLFGGGISIQTRKGTGTLKASHMNTTLADCIVARNSAVMSAIRVTFAQKMFGGGISVYQEGPGTLLNHFAGCTVSDNAFQNLGGTASTAFGGGMSIHVAAENEIRNTFVSCAFWRNVMQTSAATSQGNGGGVSIYTTTDSKDATMDLHNSFDSVMIQQNAVIATAGSGVSACGAGLSVYGGSAGTIVMKNALHGCSFLDNTLVTTNIVTLDVSGGGASLRAEGSLSVVQNHVTSSNFSANSASAASTTTASVQGGALYLDSTGSLGLTVQNVLAQLFVGRNSITGVDAQSLVANGGGLSVADKGCCGSQFRAENTLSLSNVTGNYIRTTHVPTLAARGGGISFLPSSSRANISCIDSNVGNNQIQAFSCDVGKLVGAAISIEPKNAGANTTCDVQLLQVHIEQNRMLVRKAVHDSDCWAAASVLASFGAGLAVMGLSPTDTMLDHVCFVGNMIEMYFGGSSIGAGLYVFAAADSVVSLIHARFEGNVVQGASSIGGGAFCETLDEKNISVSLQSTVFSRNTASTGGAVHFKISRSSDYAIAIVDCQFFENSASQQSGGAISFEADAPFGRASWHMVRTTIASNHAASTAAAIIMDGALNVHMKSTNFFNNTLLSMAGVLLARHSSVVAEDCSFIGNDAGVAQIAALQNSTLSATDSLFVLNDQATFVALFEGAQFRNGSGVSLVCPIGSPLVFSTSDWECQKCGDGTYSIHPNASCRACPSNAECAGGKYVNVSNGVQGFFDKEDNVIVTLQCPSDFCCQHSGCHWDQSCARGRNQSVPFCGSCVEGYSEAFGTSMCVPAATCGDPQSWGLFWLGIVLAAIYVILQLFTSSRDVYYGVRKSVLYFLQTVNLLVVDVGNAGVLGSLVLGSNVHVTAAATMVQEGLCLYPMTAVTEMMLHYAEVLLLFLILIVCFVVHVLVQTCRRRSAPKTVDETIEPSSARWAVAACSLSLTAFATVTKTTFSLLQCESIAGLEEPLRLFQAGAIPCYNNWFQILAFALLLVSVGFPFVLIWMVHRERRQSRGFASPQSMSTAQTVGQYLAVCYKPAFWYWESVLMLRRVVLIALFTFIGDLFWRSISLSFLAILISLLNDRLKPFANQLTHNVECCILWLLVALSVVGVAEAVGSEAGIAPKIHDSARVVQILLMSIPLLIFAAYAAHMVVTIVRKSRQRIHHVIQDQFLLPKEPFPKKTALRGGLVVDGEGLPGVELSVPLLEHAEG